MNRYGDRYEDEMLDVFDTDGGRKIEVYSCLSKGQWYTFVRLLGLPNGSPPNCSLLIGSDSTPGYRHQLATVCAGARRDGKTQHIRVTGMARLLGPNFFGAWAGRS